MSSRFSSICDLRLAFGNGTIPSCVVIADTDVLRQAVLRPDEPVPALLAGAGLRRTMNEHEVHMVEVQLSSRGTWRHRMASPPDSGRSKATSGVLALVVHRLWVRLDRARPGTNMPARPRILVADDDPQMLRSLEHALEEWGADVVCAADGASLVLRLADDGPFDLVITDISMPWMNGLQAMRSLRSAGVSAPILFITGLVDGKLPEQVAAMGGAARLLQKPFGPVELEAAVHELLALARDQS
jgi:CheY-like chemotaxis protein